MRIAADERWRISPSRAHRWQIMLGLTRKCLLPNATRLGVRGLTGLIYDGMISRRECESGFSDADLVWRMKRDELLEDRFQAGLDHIWGR